MRAAAYSVVALFAVSGWLGSTLVAPSAEAAPTTPTCATRDARTPPPWYLRRDVGGSVAESAVRRLQHRLRPALLRNARAGTGSVVVPVVAHIVEARSRPAAHATRR